MCFALSQFQLLKIISIHGYGDNGDLVDYLKSARLVSFFAINLVVDTSAG
jgi:hypothetical protein